MLAWLSACGADLHIAQQMPLPLTVSCSSKSRLVLTFLVLPFWYLLTRVDPDIFQTSSKTVVCVCVTSQNFQKAQLSLRDHLMCCISWNRNNCCTNVWKSALQKSFSKQITWRSFNVTANATTQWAIYHFLFVICSNSLAQFPRYYNFHSIHDCLRTSVLQ